MKQEIEDKTIILIIIGTILLVFILVFTFIPSKKEFSPSIQWKDSPNASIDQLSI